MPSATAAPVDAILFDLDDTLLRYHRSTEALLAEAFEACGTERLFPVQEYYARFDEFAVRTDSMADLRRECFAALCESRGCNPETGRSVADAFAAARDHRNVELLSGADRVLDVFEGRYRLGVVTNGSRDAQEQKIDASGVGARVETVVYAGHETAPKPDSEPFHLALDRLGVAPDRAVHVGNSLDSDVRGANTAGLRSVWIPDGADDGADSDDANGDSDPASPATPDYRLGALSELLPPPWGDARPR